MDQVFIGIPILNRPDLLERCIACIDHPAEILVINNNSVDPQFDAALDDLARLKEFTVFPQSRNLGVAASWNLILRTGFAKGHEWVFIGSNDTFLRPRSLCAAIDASSTSRNCVWQLKNWNFFLMHRSIVEDVGWFDENFYPAYMEDNDYYYRLTLADRGAVAVPGADAEHVGSATVRSNPEYALQNRVNTFKWNQAYYGRKWGNHVGRERFRVPFDSVDNDRRWWPDPGESIAQRDWDSRRRGGGSQPQFPP